MNPTVYILDDDSSVLISMKRLIESADFHVETFSSAAEFLEHKPRRNPSCLVLDVHLPDINGLNLQDELFKRNISMPIIFITGYGDIPMSVKAIKKGAVDFLPKPFEDKEILSAIEQAIFKSRQENKNKEEITHIKSLLSSITPRENEVMRWVITGLLNKQIAQKMGITEKTVKVHRGRVMKKLQVDSAVELARLLEKVGITPLEK
ncbi:MAG: response regulator transcription factor [bacterium]